VEPRERELQGDGRGISLGCDVAGVGRLNQCLGDQWDLDQRGDRSDRACVGKRAQRGGSGDRAISQIPGGA
jgi:hypothetical protein